MTDHAAFERELQERLHARASLASRPFDAGSIAHQAAIDGRRPTSATSGPRVRLLLVAALLAAAALAAVAAAGAGLRWFASERDLSVQPVPVDAVPADQLAVVHTLVAAVDSRDVDAFSEAFTTGGAFDPRGNFQTALFGNTQFVADEREVQAWMNIVDAWGLEASVVGCRLATDPSYRNAGESEVHCEVATRWHTLSMEVTEDWEFELAQDRVTWWDYRLKDLNPAEHALPLGFDGLEAWERWLSAMDPEAATRLLNPREAPSPPDCDGCEDWVADLAPGDPQRAARLAPLYSGATRDWSIDGLRFAPAGFIPYDPAVAPRIKASIQRYLASQS